jgi:putative transposase
VATTLRATLALDALEMAIWARQHEDLDGLVHHSDRGGQYLAIRYTQRLAEEGAVASVGSRGDSYDTQFIIDRGGCRPGGLTRASIGRQGLTRATTGRFGSGSSYEWPAVPWR